jgi:hypothetical protein
MTARKHIATIAKPEKRARSKCKGVRKSLYVQRILGNLATNEGFFSIDEYAPDDVSLRTDRR